MKQLYSSVDWDTINYGGVNTGPVDTEKARFIYQDCLEYYKEILMVPRHGISAGDKTG